MRSFLPASTPGGSSTPSACPDPARRRAFAGLACLLASATAGAAERLQDLAPVVEARVELLWAPVERSRTAGSDPRFHQMTAELPRVEYRLTEKGVTLMPVLESMCAWGFKNLGDRICKSEK